MLIIPVKGLFKKKLQLNTHSDYISISQRDDLSATGYLMRQFIQAGYSIIFFGHMRDYYPFIHDVTTPYIAALGYKTIVKDYSFPIIDECDKDTERIIESMFSEFGYESKYRYLNRKKNVIALKNPAVYQCHYLIDSSGPMKEAFICEAAFVNLLSSSINTNAQLHKTAVFIDMPYKPVTNIALEILNKAKAMENVAYIPLFKGFNNPIDGNEYIFSSDDEKIFIKSPKREFEVIYEQIHV